MRGVRRSEGTRVVGHAGTLDPMATGLLVVLLGEATRLVPWATGADKAYEAELALGEETDTLDAMGTVLRRAEVPGDLAARLPEALSAERARTVQVPPVVSAIHVDGERAHERARRGEAVVLRPRSVRVLALEGSLVGPSTVRLRVECEKGYYVRSLGRDLAAHLGTVGHLVALRRTRVGGFRVEEAGASVWPTPDAMRRLMPCVDLPEALAVPLRQGKRLPRAALPDAPSGVVGALVEGRPLAILSLDDDGARVLRGFPSAPSLLDPRPASVPP